MRVDITNNRNIFNDNKSQAKNYWHHACKDTHTFMQRSTTRSGRFLLLVQSHGNCDSKYKRLPLLCTYIYLYHCAIVLTANSVSPISNYHGRLHLKSRRWIKKVNGCDAEIKVATGLFAPILLITVCYSSSAEISSFACVFYMYIELAINILMHV